MEHERQSSQTHSEPEAGRIDVGGGDPSAAFGPGQLLLLQRTLGNQGVCRLLRNAGGDARLFGRPSVATIQRGSDIDSEMEIDGETESETEEEEQEDEGPEDFEDFMEVVPPPRLEFAQGPPSTAQTIRPPRRPGARSSGYEADEDDEPKRKRSKAKAKPAPRFSTTLTIQVSVVPVRRGTFSHQRGDFVFRAADVLATAVDMGNADRPDTQFGAKQASHTVAWGLERLALLAQAGRRIDRVIAFLVEELEGLRRMEQSPEATHMIESALGSVPTDETVRLPIDVWQLFASRLAVAYVQAYQASRAATFKKGRAIGRGEAWALGVLRAAEQALRERTPVADDAVAALPEAAETLLDVAFNASLGAEGEAYAHATNHWLATLAAAFPHLMKGHGNDLVAAVLRRAVSNTATKVTGAKDVQSLLAAFEHARPNFAAAVTERESLVRGDLAAPRQVAIPPSLATDFTANARMEAIAEGRVGTVTTQVQGQAAEEVELRALAAEDVAMHSITLSDRDRPDTKFAHGQLSHTVAWTLVRGELEALAGAPVAAILRFLMRSLAASEKSLADRDALALAQAAAAGIRSLLAERLPIHAWQAAVSHLVKVSAIVYQKSESASFQDEKTLGRALGHAEGYHMEFLRFNEATLGEEGHLPSEPADVIASMRALFDATINKTLSPEAYVEAILDWLGALRLRFPALMAAGEEFLVKEVFAQLLPEDAQRQLNMKDVGSLVMALAPTIQVAKDDRARTHKARTPDGDPLQTVAALGYHREVMPGTGNDCALATVHDQLTRRYGLRIAEAATFADRVRDRAGIAIGSMVDIARGGPQLLRAIQAVLRIDAPLVIDVVAAVGGGGLMEYFDVASVPGNGPPLVLTFYFNGVNHFDSLTGGPPRQ